MEPRGDNAMIQAEITHPLQSLLGADLMRVAAAAPHEPLIVPGPLATLPPKQTGDRGIGAGTNLPTPDLNSVLGEE